ncbi:hypothetical protein [Synechococcus sp. MU1650]|uniref:hypothetical protein n=1 Tax=Synechococcus sp. MU1650 TaxID=2508352 RepID=UPI001CF92D25|nr:hypothetical protein [Synechococcus sp. MU1650]MCB4378639.1 hypothetical protein [Synechococcus sp. MU1650]
MPKNTPLIDPTQIDPSFDEWMASGSKSRVNKVLTDIGNPKLLGISGYLENVVKYWIRLEIANEYIDANPSWMSKDGQYIIEQEKNTKSLAKLRETLPKELFEKKLVVGSAAQLWAMGKWKHQIERLFLASGNFYDCVDMETLMCSNAQLMTEIYYRLTDDNITFRKALETSPDLEYYSFVKREVGTVSNVISSALSRLKSRDQQITKPINVGEQYVIINLISYNSASLGEELTNKLVNRQLESWVDLISANIIKMLARESFEKTSSH